MLLKQLESVGGPNWLPTAHAEHIEEEAKDPWRALEEKWEQAAPRSGEPFFLRCFTFATDSGPDQAASAKLIDDDVRDDLYCFVLRSWCWEHQVHLIVKRQLNRMGGWYWSSLAQLAHLWRAHFKYMFEEWRRYTSLERVREAGANRVPPRPLKNR